MATKLPGSVRALEAELSAVGTKARADGEKRYLKSDLDFLGVSVPELRKRARRWLRERPGLDRARLVRFVTALWRRRVHELRSFGLFLLQERVALLETDDVAWIETLSRRAGTWAHVDVLAVHVTGPLHERIPLGATLDRWARDDDFWLRRSALLALLLPLRRGEGDWRRFVRYADSMLDEREFFVRKAIGWVLREGAKQLPPRRRDALSRAYPGCARAGSEGRRPR